MVKYYVVVFTTILYLVFGVIINIVSKVPIYTTHMYYEFIFLLKVNYKNNKYIHTPIYTYNVVM